MKLLALTLGIAAAGFVRAADTSGRIIDILPCWESGETREGPVASINDPIVAGETVYFKVCFAQSLTMKAKHVQWRYDYVGTGSEIVDELISPLKIGIYVSGRLTFAEYTGQYKDENSYIRSFVFKYESKLGDFALPIRLATDEGPAGYADTGSKYLLLNDDKWQIGSEFVTSATDEEWTPANFWYGDPGYATGYAAIEDYSLADNAGFYLKTIDFAEPEEEDPGVWRIIPSGSKRTTDIGIESSSTLTNAVTLYVWSEDDDVVKVVSDDVREMIVRYEGTEPVKKNISVGTVKIAGGKSYANFTLQAGDATHVNEVTDLVLSAYPNYSFKYGTKERMVDYVTVPVKCGEPDPANIKVVASDATVTADSDFTTAKTRLTITLNNYTPAVGEEVVVTIQPSFEADPGKTDWSKYVRFATEDTVQSLPSGDNPPTVTFTAASGSTKYLYVYALRSESAYTVGTGHQVVFSPTLDAATEAATGISGDNLRSGGIYITSGKPVISSPEEGYAETVTAGETGHEVPVSVADTYADMTDTETGYELKIKVGNTTTSYTERFRVEGEDNALVGLTTGEIPKVNIPEYTTDQDVTVQITVVSPITGKKSDIRRIVYHVEVPDIVTANVSLVGKEPGDNEYYESTADDPVSVSWKAELAKKDGTGAVNPHGTPVYAFLLCEGEYDLTMFGGSGNNLKCIVADKTVAAPDSRGKQLYGNGSSVSGSFQVLDGLSAGDGGMNYVFSIAFCTTEYYDPANVIDNEIRPGNGLDIIVWNREPEITTLYFNGFEPEGDEHIVGNQYPKGQVQEIQPEIMDAGYDLKHGFQYKWTAKRDGKSIANGTVGHEGTGSDLEYPDGTDVNQMFFNYNFAQAGIWTITIQVKDKDMSTYSKNSVYSFSVEIIDTPVLQIEVADTYMETDTRAKVAVGLGYYDYDAPIWVKLTVVPGEGDNPGRFVLDSQYRKDPDGNPVTEPDVYYISFTSGNLTDIGVEDLDGTMMTSSTKTFTLKAEVVTDTPSIDPTKTWAEYYASASRKIYIENVAPVTIGVTLENTNAWKVVGTEATSYPIRWGVKSDVDADFEGLVPSFPGIQITFSGCDNATTFYVGPNAETTTSGTFVPSFGSAQGDQVVTMTISDKDGGYMTWTYLYFVEPRKELVVRPYGPSGATESYYDGALGIGKGRVYADGQLEGIKSFVQTWSYGVSAPVAVMYATGYKSNLDADGVPVPYADNGTLGGVGRDAAIDPIGEKYAAGDYYTYDGLYDNFFYRWLYLVGNPDGGTTEKSYGIVNIQRFSGEEAVSPKLVLDTYEKDKGSYMPREVEAIFSRELRQEDNLGDINGDGIPDLFMRVYMFDAFDATGEIVGNDLGEHFVDWDDGDYLPTARSISTIVAVGLTNTWMTDSENFDPVQEIRGYNDEVTGEMSHFNDAYQILAAGIGTGKPIALLDGVSADMRFTDPTVDERSTLSYAEWVAYKAYCDAKGWDPADEAHWGLKNGSYENSWSPERPTNPNKDDTDLDGLTDGFEYYVWYQAHVGYVGIDTNSVRLTGRRYRIPHPHDPEIITSEEIERLFDPLSKAVGVEKRDTDNDGLTDLEEFVLGTNPIDFDSDGDWLPDGYEILRTGTDPLGALRDDLENPDHDAMVYTVLKDWKVFPLVSEDGTVTNGYICGDADFEITTNENGRIASVSTTAYDAWVYGKHIFARGFEYPEDADFGDLIAGPQMELKEPDLKLWAIHYDVYTELGFDPRVAWKYDTDAYSKVGEFRTKAFTHLDESMVAAFYIHMNGFLPEDLIFDENFSLLRFWAAYTTDPKDADTDHDGAPDGWELYDQRGPGTVSEENEDGENEVVNHRIYFATSPFSGLAGVDVDRGKSGEGLSQNEEFSGVISSAEYADCPTITLVNPAWQNKKWPTDQWNEDTDGDGLTDFEESQFFIYGTVADGEPSEDCIPGGGLNPLFWDTDGDMLPDPWEAEFAGQMTALETPAQPVADTNAVADADSDSTNAAPVTVETVWGGGMDGTVGDAMLDYDNDGLKNWQEYMVGTMRCWRYDDTITTWTVHGTDTGRVSYDDEYLYGVLVDPESFDFNPGFRGMHCHPGVYMSWCTNKWDRHYGDFYYFKDGNYHDLKFDAMNPDLFYMNRWHRQVPMFPPAPFDTAKNYPVKYICCDPRNPDTDEDGMDDFYELFHGLNPLLGYIDVVNECWNGVLPWSADNNYWTYTGEMILPRPDVGLRVKGVTGSYLDFFQYPWLAGLHTADPDGDNIRNTQEAIQSHLQAESTFLHTDPTPLWMTDMSYPDSLVYRYYYNADPFWNLGGVAAFYHPTGEFTHTEEDEEGNVTTTTYHLNDFPWLAWDPLSGICMVGYDINYWSILDTMYSFEQNEGYDTDGDFLGDFEESQGKTKTSSNPQDFDDPLRRQAMYFGGEENPGFLQSTMPFNEMGPDGAIASPDHMFLYFTVECWAKADDVSLPGLQTLVEHPIWTGAANAADESYLRRNFLIGLKGGRWYTKFDSSGTDAKQAVEITDGPFATTNWTHVAATYDGEALRLYVNGVCSGVHKTSIQPEHGYSAAYLNFDAAGRTDYLWAATPGNRSMAYQMMSFLIGADAKSALGVVPDLAWHTRNVMAGDPPYYFNMAAAARTGDYGGFFKGYIDEVRVWDGAREAGDILADVTSRKRYTREDAIANRAKVFEEMSNGHARSQLNGSADLSPELRYHWSFDHIPGAVESGDVVKCPAGFKTSEGTTDGMAVWARPAGWFTPWLTSIDPSIRSSVYSELAWVPWIRNTVSHLPRFDGLTRDSLYWAEGFASGVPLSELGIQRLDFARVAEPQCSWYQMLYVTPDGIAHGQDYPTFSGDSWEFEMRERHTEGEDLVPFGGAYAKRISATEGGLWDNLGAADAWAETKVDSDHNGLPDWWEQYARQNLSPDLAPWDNFEWDTTVVYSNGLEMPAWRAYMRDLARGLLPDGRFHDGKNGTLDYRDTRDVDHDGILDWWEDIYGIDTGSYTDARADADNDGLSNYVEYMLSEVFDLKRNGLPLIFDPSNPCSINKNVSDYFYRLGSLYVGEIFADHDRMDDKWEQKFFDAVSPYLYDAGGDPDGDGWSNYAEFQAGTDPTLLGSIGIDEVQIDEYPVPTIEVSVNYEGNQNVIDKPLVIKAWHDPKLESIPDAVWTVGQVKEVGMTANGNTNNIAGTKYIGMNPNKELLFHLSPGSIVKGSVKFEFKDVNWYLVDLISGSAWVFDAITAIWVECLYDREIPGTSGKGEIVDKFSEKVVGSIDYVTGAVTLNLTAVSEYMMIDGDISQTTGGGSPDQMLVSVYNLAMSYIRVKWNAKPITGAKSATYYLSDADDPTAALDSLGHVKEGFNTFIAFYDLDGDGKYTAGEPYGMLRDVDVGWNYARVKIELTDTSAISPRFNTQDGTNDREVLYGRDSGNYDPTMIASGSISGGKYERVRVIRTLIDDRDIAELNVPQRVVLDKEIFIEDEQLYVTEADFLKNGGFDLDWDTLAEDIAAGRTEGMPINSVGYRIVLGSGTIKNTETNNLLGLVFRRHFDVEDVYTDESQKPVCIGPGIVNSASPTFSWYVPNGLNSYTAFEINVYEGRTRIWNSGFQLIPARVRDDTYGWRYDWKAPIFAGDKLLNGTVFKNNANYQWEVRVTNARFKNIANWSKLAQFRMNVLSDSMDYGNIDVAVRHYGPTEIRSSGVIRVQAYETPDFSGVPAGQGYVSDTSSLGSTAAITRGNATILGLTAGNYYLRAFVDTNNDGICQDWETWGFTCARDHDSGQIYSPRSVQVGPAIGIYNTIPVYLEDSDTDQDNLPDAWEVAMYGSLDAVGVTSLDERLAGGIAVKQSLVGQLNTKGSISGGLSVMTMSALSNPFVAALACGVPVESGDTVDDVIGSFVAATEVLDENDTTVRITAVALDPENHTVRVDVSGTLVNAASPAMTFYTFDGVPGKEYGFRLVHKNTIVDAAWTPVAEFSFTLGLNEKSIEVPVSDKIDLKSGFFMLEPVTVK